MAAVLFETPFSFSENGKYLAFNGNDGKLKLWDTTTGTLKQEYTKNLHLSAPCSCLVWLQTNKAGHKQRKRKLSGGAAVLDTLYVIAIGTTSGTILLYSVDTNSIIKESSAGHTDKVSCVTASGGGFFSCADDKSIVQWDVAKLEVKSKWKSGKDKVKSILALSCGEKLVTASSEVKLWDIAKKEVLATYTGHASEVFIIRDLGKGVFVTAAKGDRYLSAWSTSTVDASHASQSYLLQDSVASLDVSSDSQLVCGVSESGLVHVFEHKIKTSGKLKPLKPKLNITVASEGDGPKGASVPLPIQSATFLSGGTHLLIAYGNPAFLQFEKVQLSEQNEEHVVLLRTIKKRVGADEFNSRTRMPDTQGEVEYVKGGPSVSLLRKQRDVPLEQRLDNLALTPGEGPPKKDNMAHLLVQGLQSRDRDLIQDVLFRGEDSIINSTVHNIPVQALSPLLRELTHLLHGKTFTNRIAVRWLNAIVKTHAAIILANPELQKLMAPLAAAIEEKMEGLAGLLRLYGRLNLVAQQMSASQADDDLGEPLVTYQHRDETESESESPSSSDDVEDWDEFSDMDENADDAD